MTKEELAKKLKERLVHKREKEIVWGDIVSAIASASAGDKDIIVTAAQTRDYPTIQEALFRLVRGKIEADAADEAASILTDDSIDLTELERIL